MAARRSRTARSRRTPEPEQAPPDPPAADAAEAAPGTPGPSGTGGAAEEEATFEASLERLESLVDRLERDDLDLEDALRAFEEGVRLSVRCAERLDAAERRIEVLLQEGGEWVARPFEGDELEAAGGEPEETD